MEVIEGEAVDDSEGDAVAVPVAVLVLEDERDSEGDCEGV